MVCHSCDFSEETEALNDSRGDLAGRWGENDRGAMEQGQSAGV